MTKITAYLILVLAVDMFLFFGQTAVYEVNPGGSSFYDYDGTLLKQYDSGNYTLDEDVINQLPGGESSVSPETGNIFTDIFTSIKNWIGETTGLRYVLGVVNAVPNFLKVIGLPSIFTFMVGALWHATTLFLIIMLIWGRDQ